MFALFFFFFRLARNSVMPPKVALVDDMCSEWEMYELYWVSLMFKVNIISIYSVKLNSRKSFL